MNYALFNSRYVINMIYVNSNKRDNRTNVILTQLVAVPLVKKGSTVTHLIESALVKTHNIII